MKIKSRRFRIGCLGILCAGLAGMLGVYASINIWPSVGAQAADLLRGVLGNQAVAQLETVAFEAKDKVKQAEYAAGVEKPVAPWQAADEEVVPIAMISLAPTATPNATDTPIAPTPAPTSTPWRPAGVITPLGTLKGEGVWTPYVQDTSSQVFAFRTFLQPDPERPYSIVAVVAFDLTHTRLHYVLGSEEPSLPKGPRGSGKIAPEYKAPGVLLSTFNGGFKATHGQFGAMADGVVALPPREGLGVVAIYQDGRVQIGEWGTDIVTQTNNMIAWRENGRLIIQRGKITSRVFSNLISDWGGTIDGKIVTWRSALGLSADGDTLYYFAGPSMSMPALAKAMMAVGTYQGMLLDINAYWVHFAAIRAEGDKLTADPLLPEMKEAKDRYLNPYSRDFFYVTTCVPRRTGATAKSHMHE